MKGFMHMDSINNVIGHMKQNVWKNWDWGCCWMQITMTKTGTRGQWFVLDC
jgi:hypothetical protein